MSVLDNVYNYYEKLVLEEVVAQQAGAETDQELVTDVVCLALNRLPARYFRHGVDMAFYLSSGDFLTMREKVKEAVRDAYEHISLSDRQ